MNEAPETRLSLLHRVRESADSQAWEEFVSIYEPLVYRLARRRGLQDADAREISQEVLVVVAGAIDRWEPTAGQGSFRSWLFRIARNLVINFLVAQQRRPTATGDTKMLQLLNEQLTPSENDSALFDDELRRQLFRTAAESVRPAFQPATWEAFYRTCVSGESIADVARQLDLSVGSVYAARSRVIAKIGKEVRRMQARQDN